MDRRPKSAQTIEIAIAVALGFAIALVPGFILDLVGFIFNLRNPIWESVQQTTARITLLLGIAVVIWRLSKARSKGL